MSDVEAFMIPEADGPEDDEDHFVEVDPVGATLETADTTTDLDPRTEFDDALPGTGDHLHDVMDDIADLFD